MIRSRRDFLKSSVCTLTTSLAVPLAATTLPTIAQPGTTASTAFSGSDAEETTAFEANFGPDRVLRLLNVHTGERYEGPFWSQGRFVSAGLDQINYLLRDYRIGESLPIDPLVVDFMHVVYAQLDTAEPIQILSGYRSPETNAKLAKNSGNVARNSLHMKGQAIDFRVPGHSANKLRKLAVATRRGGVGYYRESDFIHIDTGAFRQWGTGKS